MVRLILLISLSFVVTTWTPKAAAEDAGHIVSLTISPLHLIFPIVEVTGEVRLPADFSVAAIGGVGRIAGFTAWEVGAQGRYYLIGGFEHGMPLGVEASFVQVEAREDSISGTGQGLGIGPFVGYKFASDLGFTIDLAGGVQFGVVRARATDGESGETARASSNTVYPLLNLNLGWSF
jgi:hypothetical protein